jgi:phage shock protein A
MRDDSKSLSDAVMDTCGIKKIEDEIGQAKHHINSAKQELLETMAKELQTVRKIETIESQKLTVEANVTKALAQADQNQAWHLAQNVVEMEQDISMLSQEQKSCELYIVQLKSQMERSERHIKDVERQLTMIRTTENVQHATDAITKNFTENNAKFWSVKQSLSGNRAKQQSAEQMNELGLSTNFKNQRVESKDKSATGPHKSQIESVLKRLKKFD